MRKIRFLTDGQAELDGHPLSFNEGMELVLIPAQEITEERVTQIIVNLFATHNVAHKPAGGRVKWFIDELGARWVKFQTAPGSGPVVDRVFPAERVVEVDYEKGTF